MKDHTVEYNNLVEHHLDTLLVDYKHRNIPLIVEMMSYKGLEKSYRPVRYFIGSNFIHNISIDDGKFQVEVNKSETKSNNNITFILPSRDIIHYDFAWATNNLKSNKNPSLIIYISNEAFLVKSYIRICPTDFLDASLTRTDFIC